MSLKTDKVVTMLQFCPRGRKGYNFPVDCNWEYLNGHLIQTSL